MHSVDPSCIDGCFLGAALDGMCVGLVMPMGTVELPVYQWKYYNVKALVDRGLAATNEGVVAGTEDLDIHGDTAVLEASSTTFTINWFAPDAADGYRAADDATALSGTSLTADDLTWNGGDWMPVLEPVVDFKKQYEVLGYTESELLWM